MVVIYSQKDDAWKIIDFGLTTTGTSQERPTEFSSGTPGYRPQGYYQIQLDIAAKNDIWALGCILNELVTGKVAFTAD